MSETKITQNSNLDVAALFQTANGNANSDEPIATPSAAVNKTPLQMMQERQGKGVPIVNNNDDGPKRGGSMTDERIDSVQKTMNDMDELAEKARLVGITKRPETDLEMAELVDRLDKLDIDDLRAANQEAAVEDGDNVVQSSDVIGSDISADTIIAGEQRNIDNSGLFVPASAVKENAGENKPETPVAALTNTEDTSKVSVLIEKEATKEGDRTVVEFTPEEREKMSVVKQIELITVNTININTGKVVKPDENFLKDFTSQVRKSIGVSALMTFVASRFRVTLRGLTFGEYMDLALSADITEVETLTKKLSVIYNAIINSSIGMFTSFDDFLRNFAFKDVSLGTYGLYIATNPESLELGLLCGVDSCKKNFSVGFNPRNLLITKRLSPRFIEIMETAGSLDGEEAVKYHNDSSIITKQIIELPGTGVGLEIGNRSCYDMIHSVLPFINDIEAIMNEKHPDDTNKVREIITYVTNYVSAIYFKDENQEYTIREDNIENIVEVLYNVPLTDYEIISAIMNQTDEDYAYSFGVQNVVCPSCGNVTEVVAVDIDEEVFRQFQELGSTRIDKKSLPRL